MPTLEKNKAAIQNLIARANSATGKADTDLTSGVNSLIEGFGKEDVVIYDGEVYVDEGATNNFTDDYTEGKTDGIAEGFEQGKKSYYDEFWDSFQNYGKKSSYPNAFTLISYTSGGWTDATYNPKYEIVCNGNANGANSVFVWNNQISDIKVPVDCSGVAMTSTFLGTYLTLKRIPLLRVNEQTTFNATFDYCHGLITLIIDGVIGQNGFNVQWSTKLSKASWVSIMTAASTTASITITGSLVSVNKAFETSPGANDGSTSPEWLALKAARPTVSVSLV